ncbi:hypothetical protein FRC02_004161 [Tulasnella sp. 418]|nr:hypothetical protein FRC02_004161 [Tulasnella sp. 418]
MTTPSLSESYTLSGSDTASPDIVNKMIYESLSPPPDFADLDISGNHNLNQGKEDNGTNGEETDELASSHTSPNPPLGAVLPMFSSSPLQYSDDMDVDKENGTDKEAQNEDVPLDEENPFKYFSQELVNLLTNSPSIHEDEDNLPDVKN